MTITIVCTGCGATLRAPDAMAGKMASCKRCGRKVRIPELPPPSSIFYSPGTAPPVRVLAPVEEACEEFDAEPARSEWAVRDTRAAAEIRKLRTMILRIVLWSLTAGICVGVVWYCQYRATMLDRAARNAVEELRRIENLTAPAEAP